MFIKSIGFVTRHYYAAGMSIRRTSIKSQRTGEPYYTCRLVESIRTDQGARQHTLMNLGRHFDVPREQWAALAQRIEQLLSGQQDLIPLDMDSEWESTAQHYAAQVIRAKARQNEADGSEPDYQTVDVDRVEVLRPRSVGIEHVALSALRQVELDWKLSAFGFIGPQVNATLGTLIARMVAPGCELATHEWLQQHSSLGELTNTYFEGSDVGNANAALGHSKEKRLDCPLITLALVLDSSGFPKKSEVFTGNASESKTLTEMLEKPVPSDSAQRPTVVLDAGIATEENIEWLKANKYCYLVVSRKHHRQFDEHEAVIIREEADFRIQAQRVVNPETGEVELYCHSSQREKKQQAIHALCAKCFETAIEKLAEGLNQPRTIKQYDKVMVRLGRLKQTYAKAAQYYAITVEHDEASGKATSIHWNRKTPIKDTLPGVYSIAYAPTRFNGMR
jgi:hypothetical protein